MMNKSSTRLLSSKYRTDPLKQDPSQLQCSLKMSEMILQLPPKLQARFKALKVLYDKEREIELEEEQQYRELEKKYEQRLAEVYDEREDVLTGEYIESDSVVAEYDKRSLELQDSNYFLMKVDAVDISILQNQGATGVKGFWYQAMRNHPKITKLIHDNDRDSLTYLRHIETKLHQNGHGFDLIFRFDSNPYFKDSTLHKKYYMRKSGIIDEVEGCSIFWSKEKRATNLFKQALQRKLSQIGSANFGESKNLSTATDTFYQFFKHKKPLSSGQAKSITIEQEDEMRERMELDYEYGLCFKDQLIPLALEYYLGAMGQVKDSFGDNDYFGLDSTALLNYDENTDDLDEDPKSKSKKKFEEINQMFAHASSKGCNQQ